MNRLEVLLSLIPKCNVLADVGCDHGYLSKYALDKNLCNKVIISDISAKSLEKAITLLKPYGDKVKSYVCNGLTAYENQADFAVIAGMGGEEICLILKGVKTLPNGLLLAPQKNNDKVRRLLIELGYKITRDFTFLDVKFYDVIKAEKGIDSYTEKEFIFGRDNLKERPNDFIKKLEKEEKLLSKVIENDLSVKPKLHLIREVLNEN
jgi:tRNA (adenine22-N1)-methyltransferase